MQQLVGTWRLVEWDCTLDGVYHAHPFGRDAEGTLFYTADGFMSAILMRPNRPPFDYPSLTKGSAAEKASAIDGYVSYAGTYRTEGTQVIHSVEYSLLPNWIGTDLVRQINWTTHTPPQLLLTTLPQQTRSGKVVINRLRWEKR